MDDLIRGLVALAESDAHLPINIGNPDEYTLLQLAETVIEVAGSRSEIVYEALPVDDPKVRQPDITKARELLGWEPEVELRDGLKRTIDEAGRRAARRLDRLTPSPPPSQASGAIRTRIPTVGTRRFTGRGALMSQGSSRQEQRRPQAWARTRPRAAEHGRRSSRSRAGRRGSPRRPATRI